MRGAAFLLLALAPSLALAQARPEPESEPADAPAAGGFSAGPGVLPKYETRVEPRSPEYAQDRTFGATRFWKPAPRRASSSRRTSGTTTAGPRRS